jgi:hypothetical protein
MLADPPRTAWHRRPRLGAAVETPSMDRSKVHPVLKRRRSQASRAFAGTERMKRIAEVILIDNSTAGTPPRKFPKQTVEIVTEATTVVPGVDGGISTARHPSEITWHGGTIAAMAGVTDIKLVADNGVVVIDGELNTNRGAPRAVANGVRFFVL